MPDELANAMAAVQQSLAALQAGQAGLLAEQRSTNQHLQRLSERVYGYIDKHGEQHTREEAESRKRGQATEQRITRVESTLQARSVLGAVGFGAGDLPTGLAGLELAYDDVLAGSPGERVLEVARDGRPIASGESSERASVPGSDVVTTIDRQLQYGVQVSLAEAVRSNDAKGGTVIVLDPHTGEPTRIRRRVDADGKTERIATKSGEAIMAPRR